MEAARAASVLQRKAAAGRAPSDPFAMSPGKALRLALTRAAQEQMALPLRVSALEEGRMTLADLPEALEERALLAVLEGPGEALGLMALSQPLLATLIEMQTMGRLGSAPPAPRRPTRIDAAISAEFVDAVLAGFEADLAGQEAAGWAAGFRYASFLDDPRPLGLILEETEYRSFRLDLDLGAPGAGRAGGLLLALPAKGRRPRPAARPEAEDAGTTPAEAAAEAEWAERVERMAMAAPVPVEAVLARLALPLSAVMALHPGSVIPIALEALEALRLEGPGGTLIAGARLGQHRGFRALRIVGPGAAEGAGPAAETAAAGSFAFATPPGGDLIGDLAAAPDLPGLPELDLPDPDAPFAGLSTPMPLGSLSLPEPAEEEGAAGTGAGDLPPLRLGSAL